VVAALAGSFVLSVMLLVQVRSEANSQDGEKDCEVVGFEHTITLCSGRPWADAYPTRVAHSAGAGS